MKKQYVISGIIIAAFAGWYFFLRKDKTAMPIASKPVDTSTMTDEDKAKYGQMNFSGKGKRCFSEAVRKDFNIMTPPPEVSDEVWNQVIVIEGERKAIKALNAKPPVYL